MSRRKPALVPCYALRDVLTAKQWAAVEPFACATFTETWAACWADYRGGYRAREVLCGASSVWGTYADEVEQGSDVERALYAKAQALGCPVVMGPPRRRS